MRNPDEGEGLRTDRARALAMLAIAAIAVASARWAPAGSANECPHPSAASEPARVVCEGGSASFIPLGVRRALGLPVDLNALTAEDFDSLPGIGPRLARHLVEERARVGGFRSVEEVSKVKGIGPARLLTLRSALGPSGP
jgi:hypothetical protein